MRLSQEAAGSMKTHRPSEASRVAVKQFAGLSDRLEDLRMKHKLTRADVATPERINELALPKEAEAELLRLDEQMAKLAPNLPV